MDLRQYLVTEWWFQVEIEIKIYILIYYLLMDYHLIEISTSWRAFEIISSMQVQIWLQYIWHDCKVNLWKHKPIKQVNFKIHVKRVIKITFSILHLLWIIIQKVSHYALVQMKARAFGNRVFQNIENYTHSLHTHIFRSKVFKTIRY